MERITFSVSGPAPDENRLGPETLDVALSFGSDQDAFDGFDALLDKVAAALDGQGLNPDTNSGETLVLVSARTKVDDKGAPGIEHRNVSKVFRADHSVHKTRDLIVKAMEDADLELLN